MAGIKIAQPKVGSRGEGLRARKQLLVKEKALSRQRDAVSRERRELPWVRVAKEYLFDGPGGKRSLADLFDRRSQGRNKTGPKFNLTDWVRHHHNY
jgi:predicted dithiol-disulfide oxidoreductase (DUF899 family)